MTQQFYQDSIFWVELDKIHPNPYQPRKEFDEAELQSLADSIHQYGVLQALVVTRSEEVKEDGIGLHVYYELISGERRLRASRLAGVKQVPVIIRTGDESKQMKLELAIIENVQREDLNVVDRARAFQRLIDEFEFPHSQVAKKVGKSREYVTNSLRVLRLPEYILNSLSDGSLSEGHARPLNMLNDRPEEQETLYKEIIYKKMSVREAERIARKIARDKVRKRDPKDDPKTSELEQQFSESLGTRVSIERREQGGKLSIDFFSDEDLDQLLHVFKEHGEASGPNEMMERFIQAQKQKQAAEQQQNGGASEERVMTNNEQTAHTPETEPAKVNTQNPEPAVNQVTPAEEPVASQYDSTATTPAEPAASSAPTNSVDQPEGGQVSSPESKSLTTSTGSNEPHTSYTQEESEISQPNTETPHAQAEPEAPAAPESREPVADESRGTASAELEQPTDRQVNEIREEVQGNESVDQTEAAAPAYTATPDEAKAKSNPIEEVPPVNDQVTADTQKKKDDDDDLYSVSNFTI